MVHINKKKIILLSIKKNELIYSIIYITSFYFYCN